MTNPDGRAAPLVGNQGVIGHLGMVASQLSPMAELLPDLESKQAILRSQVNRMTAVGKCRGVETDDVLESDGSHCSQRESRTNTSAVGLRSA